MDAKVFGDLFPGREFGKRVSLRLLGLHGYSPAEAHQGSLSGRLATAPVVPQPKGRGSLMQGPPSGLLILTAE